MADRYASLKQGLVGAWIPSISGSGLLLPDLSGRGNHGSLTNMDASDWVSSGDGRALDFDILNDTVSLGANVSTGGNVSVTGWIRRNGGGQNSNNVICAKGSLNGDSSSTLALYYNDSLGWSWFCVDAGNNLLICRSLSSTSLNQWYFVCGTLSANNLRLYVDGQNVASVSGGAVKTSTHTTAIGRADSIGGNCQLDDIRVFNRELTESEIRLLSSEPGIGFKPAKKLSRFSTRYTYKPPKAKVFEGVRVRDHDYASLRQGLVGAWCPSLPNGGSGNTLPDQSGRGNHGTLTNMGPEDWVSSGDGRALDFDGSNDYIQSRSPFGTASQPEVTASAFIRINSGYGLVMISNSTTGFFWYAGLSGAAVAGQRLYIGGTAFPGISSVTAIPSGWNHIAFTYNRTAVAFYLNGVNVGTATGVNDPAFNNQVFQIGGYGSAETLNGQLDDIRVFSRALTEPEIRLLASRPGIGLQPSPTRFIAREKKTGLRRKILTGQT